jgi:hypothetical protein
VVEVAGGSYPSQTLPADPSKAGNPARVVFRPAPGAAPTIVGELNTAYSGGVGPKHFELRDLKITGYIGIRWGAEDVILRNIDAGAFALTSARNVRVYGGDFGPWVNGVSHINACGEAGCYATEDVVIDGALFHDYTISNSEQHSECLMIWPGRKVTIRNSTFRNCTDFDILISPYNWTLVGQPGEIVLENNFFDEPMPGWSATSQCNPNCPRGGAAISLEERIGWSGVQIRYNSLLGPIQVDSRVGNVVVKGNVGPKDAAYSCQSNVSFSYNVWSGVKCSPSDRVAALSSVFLGATSALFDLRLKAGSAAIGAGDPLDYPARDREGENRPQGKVDAGADERP